MNAPLMIAQRGGLSSAPTDAPAPPSLAAWLAHFWYVDRIRSFTAPETRLFYYWLDQFQAAGWPDMLPGRERLVAAQLNLSEKVLALARTGLINRGLLHYEVPPPGHSPRWGLPLLSRTTRSASSSSHLHLLPNDEPDPSR